MRRCGGAMNFGYPGARSAESCCDDRRVAAVVSFRGGRGGCDNSFVACFSRLAIDHESLLRRSTGQFSSRRITRDLRVPIRGSCRFG